MTFGAPAWLLALPIVVAALAGLWWWAGRRARAALQRVFNTPLLGRLLRSVNPARRRAKRILLALGVAALGFALARPQWGRNEIELERSGVDLVIALDVSRSMLAADAGGTNRLAAATAAIRRLLDELGGDRVALVVFAGEAFTAAPLTRDHTAVDRALDAAGPESVSEQGSDLGEAIRRARECFDRAAQGPRTLLVVSDGEQLQGDALEAARAAAREGIRVHTAGVGSNVGARVPRRAGELRDFLRGAAGREVVSRRDEQQLQRIATAGNGTYTRLEGADSNALAAWFRRVAAALPRTTEKRTVNEPREQFQWPLAVALALLGGEWLLGERGRARRGPPATGRLAGANLESVTR
jgi:Ca-activated chloride channel family protein